MYTNILAQILMQSTTKGLVLSFQYRYCNAVEKLPPVKTRLRKACPLVKLCHLLSRISINSSFSGKLHLQQCLQYGSTTGNICLFQYRNYHILKFTAHNKNSEQCVTKRLHRCKPTNITIIQALSFQDLTGVFDAHLPAKVP